MPWIIAKVANKQCYKVINTATGKVLAQCSTLNKAKEQLRILKQTIK